MRKQFIAYAKERVYLFLSNYFQGSIGCLTCNDASYNLVNFSHLFGLLFDLSLPDLRRVSKEP